MKASSVLVFSCFVFLVSCSVQFQDIPIDHNWEVMGRVDGSEELTVRFALKQQNLDILNDLFWKISDPTSEMFREYLTRDQAMDLISPPQEVQDLVVNWALENGCKSAESFGDWVKIRANASVFEQLLGKVEIYWVKDLLSGEISAKIPTSSYSLPSRIASVVDFVQNIAMFTHKHKISSRNPVPRNPVPRNSEFFTPASEDLVVPGTIYNLYNISQSLIIGTNSSQNVVEFSATAYQPNDLVQFTAGAGVQTPNDVTTVGSFIPAPPDTECTLDIEMITSVGKNGTNFFWTTSGWLLDFTEEILTYANPPLVNSISWATDERSEGTTYNFRCDTSFQLLGTMGISVLAASGDEGAVGTSSCTGNLHEFNPAYPATSPFVTSVGATMLVGDPTTSTTIAPVCDKYTCASTGTEDPADENFGGYATGGGFSVYETRPSYQNTVVTAYLTDSSIPKPPSQYFNSSNRGFPDVAAIGYQILIYINDKWESVGGTSAATPCWGGVFALANDLLMKNGKKPLGFANPFLYQMYAAAPKTFSNIGDLTTNNDDGCPNGYTSNPNGWDPVTGLGTPNVGNILSYIQANLANLP